MTRFPRRPFRLSLCVLLMFVFPAIASAQPVTHFVSNDAELRAAVAAANPGETILFTASITLLQELPSIASDIIIDGGGHTLSGGGAFRGLTVANFSGDVASAADVTIQNLSIANTLARGGDGGSGL